MVWYETIRIYSELNDEKKIEEEKVAVGFILGRA